MIVDCSGFCGGYRRNGGEPICWEGYSVSEDHKVETQRLTDKRMAWFAALHIQVLAKTILRGEKPVEEWTDAQGNAAFPTSQEFLEGILLEIVGQLKWQRRHGFHEQQQELNKTMASVVMAWTLEEKQSEGISANQPVSGRLEEDAEAAEQETPPQPPELLPPHQSMAAKPLALLSPPEEVGGDKHEGVIVSENMVVEVGGVMACDGGKGMMESLQMDEEKELLRQQPHQQQPQLPGAAAPNPWPLPQAPQPSQQSVEAQQLPMLSPPQEVGGDEHEGVMVSENMVVEIGGVVACDGGKWMMEMEKKEELLQQQPNQQQPQLPGAADPDPWPPPMAADLVDESNSDWGIASHDFQVSVLGGRATAGSFAFFFFFHPPADGEK